MRNPTLRATRTPTPLPLFSTQTTTLQQPPSTTPSCPDHHATTTVPTTPPLSSFFSLSLSLPSLPHCASPRPTSHRHCSLRRPPPRTSPPLIKPHHSHLPLPLPPYRGQPPTAIALSPHRRVPLPVPPPPHCLTSALPLVLRIPGSTVH
nr:extensin-like [Arachis hypogaea]